MNEDKHKERLQELRSRKHITTMISLDEDETRRVIEVLGYQYDGFCDKATASVYFRFLSPLQPAAATGEE